MAGMGFPLNASFRPYLVLRNATGRALPVALRLNWMEGEAPRTLPLPTQVLAPAATRRVHLGQFMDRAGLGDFDGSVNLLLSFNGRAGELVPAAGSMDETHNYVFEVPPQGAAPTSGREAITWQLRAGFDTMLTLWNWGEKAEDVVATFYYGDGTGKYELPEHLAAGASATIDLMQLAESGQPDASGQTFSMSPGYGSATIETADGKHGWMDLAEAAGVYNPVTATCGVVCVTCCGYGSVGIDPNPLILRLQADGYPVADGEYSDGTVTDFSGTWSSSDTRIATVAAGGPPVQGVAVGQADVTAYLTNVPVNAGQICAATDPSCPPPYNPEPTGGVAVTPTVAINCSKDISYATKVPTGFNTGSCVATGNPAGGTYSWSTSSGTISLASTSSSSVQFTSQGASGSKGDTSVTVTYTLNGQSSRPATYSGITVHEPTSLTVASDSTNPTGKTYTVPCPVPNQSKCAALSTSCTYSSYLRERQFDVLDQFGQDLAAIGLNSFYVHESLPVSGTCPGAQVQSSTSDGLPEGTPFPDSYYLGSTCCAPGGPGCSMQTNPVQTIYVDDMPVRQQTITWTCTDVTVTP